MSYSTCSLILGDKIGWTFLVSSTQNHIMLDGKYMQFVKTELYLSKMKLGRCQHILNDKLKYQIYYHCKHTQASHIDVSISSAGKQQSPLSKLCAAELHSSSQIRSPIQSSGQSPPDSSPSPAPPYSGPA